MIAIRKTPEYPRAFVSTVIAFHPEIVVVMIDRTNEN